MIVVIDYLRAALHHICSLFTILPVLYMRNFLGPDGGGYHIPDAIGF